MIGEFAVSPPVPVSIAKTRYDQASPPISSPAGIATGAAVTRPAPAEPLAARSHICRQAPNGSRHVSPHCRVRSACAARNTPTMGAHQAAARYSRLGGQPSSQASTYA